MIKPEYNTYKYGEKACTASAQSRVECRISAAEIGEILAVRVEAYPENCNAENGGAEYGGKALFTMVCLGEEKHVFRVEKGVEFSHRIECETIAENDFCVPELSVTDVSRRREGTHIVVSAVVCASVGVYKDKELLCLSGGEGVVVKKENAAFYTTSVSVSEGEQADEFETAHFSDILLHDEHIAVKSVTRENGVAVVEGEIALNVCVLKSDDTPMTYERLVPFRAETELKTNEFSSEKSENDGGSYAFAEDSYAPFADISGKTDGAAQNTGAAQDSSAQHGEEKNGDVRLRAKAMMKSAIITAETSEAQNKSTIKASFSFIVVVEADVCARFAVATDAYSVSSELRLNEQTIQKRRLKSVKYYVKKVEGEAALNASIDYTTAFLATALPNAEASAKRVSDSAFEIEGAVVARLFKSDQSGLSAADVTLPFLLTETGEIGEQDETEVSVVACSIAVKQKKEGVAEAEATLKITVCTYEKEHLTCIVGADEGEAYAEERCALSVLLPRAGDGLWETAKNLRKTPEEVQRSNPDLVFPLKGNERIIVYNGR